MMAKLCDFGAISIKSEGETRKNTCSDDLDNLPLTSRRRLLLAIRSHSDVNRLKSGVCEEQCQNTPPTPQVDVLVKTEDGNCDSEKLRPLVWPTQSLKLTQLSGPDVPATKINDTLWSNELDHIPLSTRMKMLLATRAFSDGKQLKSHIIVEEECRGTSTPHTAIAVKKEDEHCDTQGSSGGVSEDHTWQCAEKQAETQKEEIRSVTGKSPLAGTHLYVIPERNTSDLCRSSEIDLSNGIITGTSFSTNQCSLPGYCFGTKSRKRRSDIEMQGSDHPSEKISTEQSSSHGHGVTATRNSVHSSNLSTSVKIKIEPLDNSDLPNLDRVGNSFNLLPVKSELKVPDELCEDEVDHMLLRDRLRLMRSGEDSASNSCKNSDCLEKTMPTAVGCSPIALESVKPISIKRPRKRRKTATDSVETALEEDAPGLLQVLVDKGITVDEIKLYGETENDDPLDESFSEDSFSDLEAVISKLFSQHNSLLKLAPVKCTKGSKAMYCLACLFSLVEQTRYLQFRKWPVEWGWCRDLQSFIFVFERHRRIVLERPEYGYATYFFELVDTLPIDWQIKRLVIAMKLTSCSRVTLIENRALSVGEDLSEGEARVLMDYGWIPHSGLGTMLNYRDRVVHDRKNNEDRNEWRSKIGKLLMDGYNGGRIVSTTILDTEYQGTEIPEIKVELD